MSEKDKRRRGARRARSGEQVQRSVSDIAARLSAPSEGGLTEPPRAATPGDPPTDPFAAAPEEQLPALDDAHSDAADNAPAADLPGDEPTNDPPAEQQITADDAPPADDAVIAAPLATPTYAPTDELAPDTWPRDRPEPVRLTGDDSDPPKDRRWSRRGVAVTRSFIIVAVVMALLGTGFAWGYLKSKDSRWHNVDAINQDKNNVRNLEGQRGNETYLIVGTDTRAGKNGTLGAGTTADAGGARADTIILVNIPADRSRAVAVSFPRDLDVDRPDCRAWDNDTGTYNDAVDVPAETHVKLNSVYGDGGPSCLVNVLTAMTGLDINHFIAMDFVGFERIINKLGGVKVCSTTALYDYELGQIIKVPGTWNLTGKRALNYVRARMIEGEGNGDYGRIKRQQMFLSSLLRSTLSTNVLTNPSKLNSIIDTFIDNSFVDDVDTDSLLHLAQSMQGLEAGRVTFLTVPTSGTSTDGQNNEIPRTADIRAIFDAIIDRKPLPGEAAQQSKKTTTTKTTATSSNKPSTAAPAAPLADLTTIATSAPSIGIRILNGTGRTNQAVPLYNQLVAQGWDIRGVADASINRTDTVVRYGLTTEKSNAATIATMFPGSKIQLDTSVKSGVEVILGSAYVPGSMQSPTPAGTSITVGQLARNTAYDTLPNDLSVTNGADTTCS